MKQSSTRESNSRLTSQKYSPHFTDTFFLRHRVQNDSGAHPASYPMENKVSFSGGKVAGAWSWPLTPSSAEVKECVEQYFHSPNTPS
jgi:hypothetical protein